MIGKLSTLSELKNGKTAEHSVLIYVGYIHSQWIKSSASQGKKQPEFTLPVHRLAQILYNVIRFSEQYIWQGYICLHLLVV